MEKRSNRLNAPSPPTLSRKRERGALEGRLRKRFLFPYEDRVSNDDEK